MNGDWLGETNSPTTDASGSVNSGWLGQVLNTGLGVAGLFANRTPASQRTGTPGAPNWTMIGLIVGGIVLLVVAFTAMRR